MPIYPKMERHCPFNFGLGITLVPVPLLQREAQKCLAVGILGLGVWRLGEPVEIAGTVGDWHGFAIASAPSHRIATFEVYVPTAWIGERESLAGGESILWKTLSFGIGERGGVGNSVPHLRSEMWGTRQKAGRSSAVAVAAFARISLARRDINSVSSTD
jgi:hypothetical protein